MNEKDRINSKYQDQVHILFVEDHASKIETMIAVFDQDAAVNIRSFIMTTSEYISVDIELMHTSDAWEIIGGRDNVQEYHATKYLDRYYSW
jgi:hypothetical protein